ncbi:2-amino-4-hydroxy-6-hydroxymethyldihydropteridine pyrophosphokinase [Methyloligella halotolerans]|uniref:2-amino-4-hydroxy-6-hydroxymethyldihydropteridine pyrophosphokinase n=1 Tax=Methyloligella halotolerans TaxID=1177755 RepID=A0A1E2S2J1_9HYPH|nr:2-amino-4-hydroxy-6-hydroxymethyldihydropteridine diphosphokinase [Methyloligella halotolerans]ODA68600.1 2-amino-4-hydroxy-6-hydroxymethyldihydropteridine pyrophosphokinase [Methyloligella halotolerans]
MRGNALVALGANLPGPWGTPLQAVNRALAELDRGGTAVVSASPLYESEAIGQPGQPAYVNAVAEIATHMPPEALLRKLKRLEAAAGRRGKNAPWGARNLDLDIVDYGGRVQGWRGSRAVMAGAGPRKLTLPHPQTHLRSFVLVPLRDIAPAWRHPVLKRSPSSLLAHIPGDEPLHGLTRLSEATP